MQIGLIGSGNIATAFALGWGQPVLCTDIDASRAQALAAATGGEVVDGNAELAARSDLVILCHKPGQLDEVAAEAASGADVVLSPLAGVTLGSPSDQLLPSCQFLKGNLYQYAAHNCLEYYCPHLQ